MLIVMKSRYNTYLKIRRFLRMMDFLKKMDKKATGLFAAGVLFGTAGIKVLSSKDAKKAYTQVTAAALRAKECVMKVATNIQENAEDIYAEAKQINEERAAAEETVDDEASEGAATEESGLGDME
jgi:hypothetical protein